MKTTMRVQEKEKNAIIQISTNYKGLDKIAEFNEIKSLFKDAEKIGMEWNAASGEYEAEILLTEENAKPFVEYAASKKIEIIM